MNAFATELKIVIQNLFLMPKYDCIASNRDKSATDKSSYDISTIYKYDAIGMVQNSIKIFRPT